MLYSYTSLKVVDNSGGFMGLCIRILGQSKRGAIGDAIAFSVKSIILNRKIIVKRKRKVLKGTVRQAIVIRVPYYRRRFFNIFLRGSSNAIAILGN
jgi:ribosomal protein L14